MNKRLKELVINNLDSQMVDECLDYEDELIQRKQIRSKILRSKHLALAASILIFVIAIPVLMNVIRGTNDDICHITERYSSIKEAEAKMGITTLYSDLEIEESFVQVVYEKSLFGKPKYDEPEVFSVNYVQHKNEAVVSKTLYVAFNVDSLDYDFNSYIEQNIENIINGIKVRYSITRTSKACQGQIRFIYCGNMYTVDIGISDNETNILTELNSVLIEIIPENAEK